MPLHRDEVRDGEHSSSAATPPQDQTKIPVKREPARGPSRRSLRGLDWFVFFVADVQTGFGPFVAVYLTAQKWTQVDIGLVLTVGGLVALSGRMPGGALVDAARSERLGACPSIEGILLAKDERVGFHLAA
jgi:hypothetical protein